MFDIRVKEQHGDQITYVILDDLEHTRIFPTMLAELDQNMEKHQIKTYGLSNSSLEQVFLRVADEIKRPEDYQRLSNWKQFCRRLKIHTVHEKPQLEAKADDHQLQETLNTGLCGTMMNKMNWHSIELSCYFRELEFVHGWTLPRDGACRHADPGIDRQAISSNETQCQRIHCWDAPANYLRPLGHARN